MGTEVLVLTTSGSASDLRPIPEVDARARLRGVWVPYPEIVRHGHNGFLVFGDHPDEGTWRPAAPHRLARWAKSIRKLERRGVNVRVAVELQGRR